MEETAETSSETPRPRRRRWALYATLVALYLLHNDLWLWNDARLVLGLPAGLVYHVGYCLVTSVVLALLVAWAWPKFDDGESGR